MKGFTATILLLLAGAAGYTQANNNISGKLIFPSDWLPPQIVCAVPVDGGSRLCTQVKEGANRFSMRIPKGRYYLSSEYKGKKAWYTTYDIECGANCDNGRINAKIVVVDEYDLSPDSITGICPCDWYSRDKILFPR